MPCPVRRPLPRLSWPDVQLDPSTDYSKEPTTLVEFQLEDSRDGTMLTLIESGFDTLPLARRAEAYKGNEGGWSEQMKNIERHVSQG